MHARVNENGILKDVIRKGGDSVLAETKTKTVVSFHCAGLSDVAQRGAVLETLLALLRTVECKMISLRAVLYRE